MDQICYLELDLALSHKRCDDDLRCYSLSSDVFKGSPCEIGISYDLTSICLKDVDIREETLQLLLSRCPLIERLYIKGA